MQTVCNVKLNGKLDSDSYFIIPLFILIPRSIIIEWMVEYIAGLRRDGDCMFLQIGAEIAFDLMFSIYMFLNLILVHFSYL